MRLSRPTFGLAALAGMFAVDAARAQDVLPGPPPNEGRVFGPVDPPPANPPPVVSRGRGISIFIPPIGGFGGFSANIGRGRVNVNVGPSGYGPGGGPAFGGVTVDVFRPHTYSGPPVVYGPAYHPIYGQGSLYLGVVDGRDEASLFPSYTEAPTAAPEAGAAPDGQSLDAVLPPPPASSPSNPNAEQGTIETSVPQRKPQSGPQLAPQIPPQTSNDPAPRFFPTRGPAFLPPGVIPRNGFDVDNKVRPNSPTLPGQDPFGPPRPRGIDDPPA